MQHAAGSGETWTHNPHSNYKLYGVTLTFVFIWRMVNFFRHHYDILLYKFFNGKTSNEQDSDLFKLDPERVIQALPSTHPAHWLSKH